MKALCINNLNSAGVKLTYLTVKKIYNVINKIIIFDVVYYKIIDDRNNSKFPELYKANRFIIIYPFTKLKVL